MVLHDHHRRWVGIPIILSVAAGCATPRHVVPLLEAAGAPREPPALATLEVVTRSTAVPDPLPVRGSDVAYADAEAALLHAVASATAPWAQRHAGHAAGGGWQLLVEMTSADAEYDNGRALCTLGVRATLRARAGNVFLAQTQAACKHGDVVPPEEGAHVMYRCMTEVGRQLANWLDGVDLNAAAPPLTQQEGSQPCVGPQRSNCTSSPLWPSR